MEGAARVAADGGFVDAEVRARGQPDIDHLDR